ncbi:peptide deformylase [candidate division WWE3 bacterium RIFOXYC1_FULL_40_10]|uniref:Peptide deformylase n=1 Tax=candidate division WWE3 bacterium RIFOXYA2_FULL_46_9 TaxID=1802636 RepID=A0A1F4W1N9_UNCKA|nr:MAG: peptide deformylase [candidate division WWE3 bacterium RIFOXYB1_FULL_40_22]OGC61404.1 MAG: peptide deformylase [candidate division WWE3 bacterium RIFOXYA1_FULL_40_11]OGC63337.1 MAG: peptide deformylase [candidate division WWE3 bacterium RIFOXYA2_FULL_46_9]OGC65394.1 MAG: peptide deformylase [candidate division WWE3 bacterium RIFOXYB2_FULL_41_6]OGC65787.1 MAG: peptide deformylase [candidate division WWE3 bacterium RIFOXYC1_FULL_40_10]OGC67326.1 MAG: peptide deformylase [candidate divisi
MAVQKIITESDNRLRAPNSKVILIDEEVKKEILDLKDTLASAKNPEGAGLAAPQIGINKKICVVRNYTEDVADPSKVVFQEFVFINPKITSASKETNLDWEACLSVPNKYGRVSRHNKIKVTALDEEGIQFTLKASGYFAQVIQHELDHLMGVLFIDKVVGKIISGKEMEETYHGAYA